MVLYVHIYFTDPEQCDLYYECIDNIPEAKLCPDGLLFEVLKKLETLKINALLKAFLF